MIFYTVIYATLINLTENGTYSATVTKELSISLIMSFKVFNFGQIKIVFCIDKSFKYLLCRKCIVYRYKYLIKTRYQTGILL